MASLFDPVHVLCTLHSTNVGGTTVNDTYFMASTLSNYTNDIPNFASTLFGNLISYNSYGGAVRTATPTTIGALLPDSMNTSTIRMKISLGIVQGSTPNKMQLVRQRELAAPTIFSATPTATPIINFISSNITDMIPMYMNGLVQNW